MLGYWLIPENIHTILWVPSFRGRGGFLGLEFGRHGRGGNTVWNSTGIGGVQL